MTDSLDGYFSDEPYPAQLAQRMTPGWLAGATIRNGWRAPDTGGAFRMLDVGCGDGIGLAVMAASHPDAVFEGIDGLAEHIDRGQAFAADLGNIELRHQFFDQALAAGGPPCDIVTAHGVIAWVQPWIREQALDLIAARLGDGGIAAVSYNALPGWTARFAYQHLVFRTASHASGPGTVRYREAHAKARALAEAEFQSLPLKEIELLEELGAHAPPDYFPHEYINEGWQPLWSADVRAEMASRGLTYLGQAEFERQRPDFALTAKRRAAIEAVVDESDPGDWDTLYDLAVNTPFRVDLYGKAAKQAPVEAFDDVWLMARRAADADLIAKTPAGTLKFDNPAARRIMEALQPGPRTLTALSEETGLGLPDIRNATDCLLMGHLVSLSSPPCRPDIGDALNRYLAASARSPTGAEISAFAGRHGAVKVRPTHMGLLDLSAEELIAGAKADPLLKDRFFQESTDLNDPAVLEEIRSARAAVLAGLARMGVPVPSG